MNLSTRKIIVVIAMLMCAVIFRCSGQNLIPNPGFEDVSEFLGGYTSNCTITTINPHSGKNCMVQKYKEGAYNDTQSLPPHIETVAGKYYRLKAWNRNNAPSGNIYIGVRFINNKNTSISYFWKSVNLNTQQNWCEYEGVFKTPPGTVFMSIYFRMQNFPSSAEVFWDDISLTETTEPREYLTIKPLKSAVFFKKNSELTTNDLYNKETKTFESVFPSDVRLDIDIDNIDREDSILVYQFKRKYSPEILESDSYNINRQKQNIVITPKIEDLPLGHYVARVKLQTGREENAKILAEIEKDFSVVGHYDFPVLEPIKEVSIAGTELKVNGKPFIPMCFYHVPPSKEYYEIMPQFGANIQQVFAHSKGDIQARISEFKRILDLCVENNTYAYVALYNEVGLDHESKKYNLDNIKEVVNALKDHPAVFMWSLTDEPDVHKIPPAEVQKAYDFIKQLDSKHPVWVNLCLPNTFEDYAASSDIASYDHYPNPSETLLTAYEWNNLIMKANPQNKPLLSVLQTYSSPGTELPSYRWLKAEAYLCITQGMKMFFYYAFMDPEPTGSLSRSMELQSQVKELNIEIMSIADVVLAEPCDKAQIMELDDKGIHYSLRKVNGAKYLITVNTTPKEIQCEFYLPESKENEKVQVLFEDNRVIELKGQRVMEVFSPYQVHVYKYE